MSEPSWNPTHASNTESRSPIGSEAPKDLTFSQGQVVQASEEPSFPPVIYGGWGDVQGQPVGRKKTEDDDTLDEGKNEGDEGPEHDETSTEAADRAEGRVDEPTASGGSTASRLLAKLGSIVQGAGSVAKQGVAMARRYPRASMASVLSVAILGAVMILQPGKGKHDRTAQITAASAQLPTPPQTEIAGTDSPASSASSFPKADHPALEPGDKSRDLAGTELPILHDDSAGAADKSQALSPGNAEGLVAAAKEAPAPDATGIAPAPLPPGEPVKLTAGEGPGAFPPIVDASSDQIEKSGPSHVTDIAPAPAPVPAPVLLPVMELAAADVKPGTPPDAAHTPAPSVTPASEPLLGTQKPAAAPTPGPMPTPAAPAGSGGKSAAHGPEGGIKEMSTSKVQNASGAAAATIVGSAALGGGTVLGAATALGAGGLDQAKIKDKQTTSLQPAQAKLATPAPPASAPASPAPASPAPVPASASASPDVKTGEPKPLTGTPATVHVTGPDSKSQPAPLVAPVPMVVEPRSRTEAPRAATPRELPPLHPTGDTGTGSDRVAGLGGGGLVKSGGDSQSNERPRSANPVEQAETYDGEELARQGWAPIRHSGGEAVRDVQREVPGLDDDSAKGTASGIADPNAHADKDQIFDVESPPVGIRGQSANPDEARTRMPPKRREGKLETVLHKVEGRENFWDISRMYYSSGRYYKALWKANEDKVPEITRLHQGTVVRIPPPEDLDPAYIEPPGKRSEPRNDGRRNTRPTRRRGRRYCFRALQSERHEPPGW